MNSLEKNIKFFGLNCIAIENELQILQERLSINIGHSVGKKRRDALSQLNALPASLKDEAAEMAAHYVAFYCLENFVRQIIEDMLVDLHGENWWPDRIPEELAKDAQSNRKREEELGVTLRSDRMLDYLTFGQLSGVIEKNWDGCFDTVFSNLAAMKRIMFELNNLRGPIAHCCALPNDEVGRFELRVKDLMRQM